ncbi:MAG: TatD family deoxyribonuclease [Candidatus Dadabacteria bacterium]|nr:MAG: TatD family deoxyribonuclease [Candidatus Dadabacteria bacterium]
MSVFLSVVVETILIDSHCHLDSEEFKGDLDEVLERASNAGVKGIVSVAAGDGFKSAERVLELSSRREGVFPATGLHPHDADKALDKKSLLQFCSHSDVIAVGETGLDFFRESASAEGQERWFRAHIEVALEVGKPIIVHSRNAERRCFEILREMGAEAVGGVFHCYGGDSILVRELAKLNFMVSFTGVVTFKNAKKVREVVSKVPLDQLLVETDAPYMSPEPYRGQRCESAFLVETAAKIAEIKGVSFKDCAEKMTRNTKQLFGIDLPCK